MKSSKKYAVLFILYVLIHINHSLAQAPGGVSANLTTWYKANVPSSIAGNPVSSWAPAGGSATTFSVTQSVASKRPALVSGATGYTKFNYNPRIQFSTTAQTVLRNSALAPDLLGTNGVAIILSDQSAPGGTGFSYYTNTNYRYQLKPNFRFQSGGVSGLGYTFDYTGPTEYSSVSASMLVGYGCGSTGVFRENSVPKNCNNCGQSLYDPSISSGLTFGANVTSEYTTNAFGEVILYSVMPSLSDMNRIESYLAIKYGITRGGNTLTTSAYNYIASDGVTTIWDKTANTGYNSDIAGIGRDDASVLQQKQSISVNNGEAVTISLGSTAIPTENATNASTFTNNISFLVWGNNGLTNTFTTASSMPLGILQRLNRVWKSQATNFSQSVSFGFETSQVTGLGNIGTLCLLFDDDGNFSNATVAGACSATNPTGTRVEFTGITIPTGKPYFTLARVKLPTFAANNGPLCEGLNLNLTTDTISGSTYSWTGPNAFTSSIPMPSIGVADLSSSGVYTVAITNPFGCGVNTFNTNVVITPTITPSVTASINTTVTPICAGSPISFTAAQTNGGTTPVYQWQVNGVNAGTNSNTFNSSTLQNGDVVSIALTSNANCLSTPTASSNTVAINIAPIITPSISLMSSTNTICAGSSISYTATPTNGGTTPLYQWQVNGISAGTNSDTFNSSVLNNGDVVSVVLTSNDNCLSTPTANSNTVAINVLPNLTPSVSLASSTDTICAGSSVTFTSVPANGGTTPTYQWQVNGINIGANSPNFNSSTLNNGDVVTVILTSNETCLSAPTANSNTITMNVAPNLTPNITLSANTNTICAGSQVSFTATPINGGTTPIYQWQVNGINVGTDSTIFNSSTLNSGDVITVALTSNANCLSSPTANSNTVSINVLPILTPSVFVVASTNTICAGNPVSFTASPVNGGTTPIYQWQVNGTNTGIDSSIFNSSTLNNGDAVTIVLTSNANCLSTTTANSNSVSLNVLPILTPSVSVMVSTNTICAGSPVSFTATPTNGGTIPTYQWQVNGVNTGIDSSIFNSSTLHNGDMVSLILTSNANCLSYPTANSNTVSINVLPILTPSVSIIASSNTICAGSPVSFTASPVNGGTTPIYQWQVNGTNAGTNSSIFNSSTLNNGDLVTVALTSNANCLLTNSANSNTITISVFPILIPSVSITASTNTICAGSPVSFTASSTNGGTTPIYQWQVNGVNVGTNSSIFRGIKRLYPRITSQ